MRYRFKLVLQSVRVRAEEPFYPVLLSVDGYEEILSIRRSGLGGFREVESVFSVLLETISVDTIFLDVKKQSSTRKHLLPRRQSPRTLIAKDASRQGR